MSFFYNLKIRWKLTIPLIVVILLVLLLAGRSFYTESIQANAIFEVTHNELPSLNLVQQADRDFHQAWVAERSMLTLRVRSDQYKVMQQMHGENIAQVKERIQKFSEYSHSGEIRELLNQFWQVFPKWQQVTERIEQARSSDTRKGRSTAIGLSYKEGEALFNQSRDYLDKISEIILSQADQRSNQLEMLHRQFQVTQWTILIISLVICLGVLIFFPSLITRDLKQIIHRVKILAQGGGDLTQRIDIHRGDELGQLGHYLDQFIVQLNALVTQIIDNAKQSDLDVADLSKLSAQNRLSLQKQAESISQANGVSREMSGAIQTVAESTGEAAEVSNDAYGSAAKGQSQVEATRHNIEQLNSSVMEAVEAISKIEEVTSKIGSVLTVISGIAEQTNLLALNAAIEAARAGEFGRGFAVVADEVRALAGKTQLSTDDVKEMINNLDESVQSAVRTMKEASQRAVSTQDSSVLTKQAIDTMMDSIGRVTELATGIAKVTDEQSQSAELVQNHINEIEEVSQSSVEQAEKVDQSCSRLADLHQQLGQLTGKFTV